MCACTSSHYALTRVEYCAHRCKVKNGIFKVLDHWPGGDVQSDLALVNLYSELHLCAEETKHLSSAFKYLPVPPILYFCPQSSTLTQSQFFRIISEI